MPGTANFTYQRDSGVAAEGRQHKPTADLYYLEGSESLGCGDRVALRARDTKGLPEDQRQCGPKRRRSSGWESKLPRAGVRDRDDGRSHVVLKDIGFFVTTAYAGGEGTPVSDLSTA